MRFRVSSVALLIFLISSLSFAQSGQQYSTSISATSTNTSVSFGFNATSIVLKNDGAASAFVNFSSPTATITNFELKVGETLSVSIDKDNNSGWTGFGIICAPATTATVRILALKNA